MNTESEEDISKTLSELFGAATASLREYLISLPADLSQEEKRRLLLEEARQQGLATLSLLARLPAGWENEDARNLAHQVIDELFNKHEEMTAEQLAERLAGVLPWDDWLVKYVETYASSSEGTPPRITETIGLGGVLVPKNKAGEEFPIVLAFATRYTPRTRVVKQFDDAILRRFGRWGQPSPRTLAMVATYIRRRTQGKSHRQAAAEYAEETLQGRDEYMDERKRRREITRVGNMLRKNKNRFFRYATRK